MRRVKCYECGKGYDYDDDGFCPRCGAFTQPARTSRVGVDGSVIRVEGINERNHNKSFVHKEYHGENRQRKGTLLERDRVKKLQTVSKNAMKNSEKMVSARTLDLMGEVAGGVLDIVADLMDAK